MNAPLLDRYPGTRPFADNPSDQQLFYGRDDEIDTLFHRVCAARLLVLFGKSGLGKTSLLQAGVFPKLRERHMLPIPVRLNSPETPLNIIKTSAKAACSKLEIDYTPGIGETLWEFFKTAMFWQGDILLTPVLVFDQFEEIFTLKTAKERAALAIDLGDLFRNALPDSVRQKRKATIPANPPDPSASSPLTEQVPNVHVILTLREDFLGALQELADVIPGIFQDRVRLSPLSDQQAQKAITKPAALEKDAATEGQFATPAFTYAEDALATMIKYLRGKSEVIEPFQLQLICRDIEQQVAQQQAKGNAISSFTLKDLGGYKRLDQIVQNFYRQTLAKLPWRERRHAQRLCEEGLLNAEGFRLPLQENEILKSYKLSPKALSDLEESRLLRKEQRLESYFYELSHDSLSEPILNSRPLKLNRKHRNIAFGMTVLLVTFGLFGNWQWQAKLQAEAAQKQAQQEREAAEEVLNYLVFDLRDQLESVNDPNITEKIQKKIKDYYDKVGMDGQTAGSLNLRATFYSNEGNSHLAENQLEKAQQAFQLSLSLTEQAAKLEPDELAWQHNASSSLDDIGDVLIKLGKLTDAQRYYQDSLTISQKLAALEPSNTEYQTDVSSSYDNLGEVQKAQGKLIEAQSYCQKSLAIVQKLAAQEPGKPKYQQFVSGSYDNLGEVLKAQGKLTEAQRYYQDSLKISRKLHKLAPTNSDWQLDLSGSLENLSEVLSELGKPEEAQRYHQESLLISQKYHQDNLAKAKASYQEDPTNTELQQKLSEAFDELVTFLEEQGKSKEAQRYQQENLSIAQKYHRDNLAKAKIFSQQDPADTELQQEVSESLDQLGTFFQDQENLTEALRYYLESLSIKQKLAQHDPKDTQLQWDISSSFDQLGAVLNAQDKPKDAQQYYQDSLAIAQKITAQDPSDTDSQESLSESLDQLGEFMNAQDKLDQALQYYQDSLAIKHKLSTQDPSNTEWQRDLSTCYTNIADILIQQAKADEALAINQQALAILEQLTSQNPSNEDWQTDLTSAYGQVLPVLLELKRYKDAAEMAQRRVAHQLKQGDNPANQPELADAYWSLAWYELFNQQPDLAIAASEQGLKLNMNEAKNATLNLNLAHAYLFKGQAEKAKVLYLANKHKKLTDDQSFKQAVLDDFKEFRKHGLYLTELKQAEAWLR